MAWYGPQFGPDITFLGVPRCDWAEPETFADADVVILGAPFDGGTTHRAGTRFGPQYIRQTCYLPHDGSRPSLALRTDGLLDLRVHDAGDVEMYSGDAARSVADLQQAVYAVARTGAIPLILGGDHTIAWPDAAGVAQHVGNGRVSMIHFDAHADTGDVTFGSLIGHGQPMRRLIESGAVRGDRFLQIGLRGYWPPPETLDWMAEQRMRSYEMTEITSRGLSECLTEAFAIATDECDGVFLSVDIDVCDPGHAPHRHARARWPHRAGTTRFGAPDRLRTARRRGRRGGGVAAVRPRRDHVVPGQPGRPGDSLGDRATSPRRGRRHHLGPEPAATRRPVRSTSRSGRSAPLGRPALAPRGRRVAGWRTPRTRRSHRHRRSRPVRATA